MILLRGRNNRARECEGRNYEAANVCRRYQLVPHTLLCHIQHCPLAQRALLSRVPESHRLPKRRHCSRSTQPAAWLRWKSGRVLLLLEAGAARDRGTVPHPASMAWPLARKHRAVPDMFSRRLNCQLRLPLDRQTCSPPLPKSARHSDSSLERQIP
jgi:hypothetical protein